MLNVHLGGRWALSSSLSLLPACGPFASVWPFYTYIGLFTMGLFPLWAPSPDRGGELSGWSAPALSADAWKSDDKSFVYLSYDRHHAALLSTGPPNAKKNRRKSSQTTWYMSLFFRKQSVAAYYVEDGLECTLLILLQYPVERLPQSDVGCGRMLDASRHLWSIIIKLRFLLLARIAWPENDAKWCWIARYSQLIHGCSDIQCCTDATFWPCNLLKGGICYQDVCPSLCQVRPSQSWVTPKRFKISKFIGFAPHRKQYFYSSSHISQSWI